MKKVMIWLLLALCLLGTARAEDITGKWKFIGWVEYGDFEDGTEYAGTESYTFEDNGRLAYTDGGSQRPGVWEEKNGIIYRVLNGERDRVVLRADGTLLIGSWEQARVYSRDGKIPKTRKLKAGTTKDGLIYEPAGDGSLKITGHHSNETDAEYDENGLTNPIELVIPASINGMPVSMVEGDAFRTNQRIVSVRIEEGVYYVGREAFSECGNVASILLPSSLTAIDGYAFNGCNGVTEVALPYGVQNIRINPFARCESLRTFTLAEDHLWMELVDGALIDRRSGELIALPAASPAASYTVPEHVKVIGTAAFMGCRNLQFAELHEKVAKLESYAFEGSGLRRIDIPAGLTDISSNPFTLCEALEAVNIAAENPAYYSVDGVMFGREEGALIYYPLGRTDTSYTIPGSTKKVDFDAFLRQKHLTSLIIEEGVEIIEPYAFYGMENLRTVSIPEGVTRLGGMAFGECRSLQTVEIPSSVPAIESETFAWSGLQTLIVKEGTPVAEDAFRDCLNEVVIQYK